jgi:acylphosphatase
LPSALRAVVRGSVQGVGFREATVAKARELGALGWVCNGEEGEVLVHAEGDEQAVDGLVEFLREGPRQARVEDVEIEAVKVEGHEQFAIRGVSAGAFRIWEREGGGFELSLEVDGERRSWALSKEPSLDPAVKRLAIELGPAREDQSRAGGEWDGGPYEQGGRVAWPEALERGHAVFVLHGERLRGGFALQRTRGGPKAQWLLIKRRDEHAERAAA